MLILLLFCFLKISVGDEHDLECFCIYTEGQVGIVPLGKYFLWVLIFAGKETKRTFSRMDITDFILGN